MMIHPIKRLLIFLKQTLLFTSHGKMMGTDHGLITGIINLFLMAAGKNNKILNSDL